MGFELRFERIDRGGGSEGERKRVPKFAGVNGEGVA